MASLKETRTRIASVKNTRQVTSAMKMVSAAKLKKAQGVLNNFLPFTDKQHKVLLNLSAGISGEDTLKYFQESEIKKVLLIVVSANRGLCGAFNSNVISNTQKRIEELEKQGIGVELYTIGKKAHQILRKNCVIKKHNENIFDALSYDKTTEISNEVMDLFLSGEFDKVELIYNHSKSAGTQVVVCEDYMPVTQSLQENEIENDAVDYIFEPSKKEIMETLVPQILRTQFYKSLLDSDASEHAARMISMNKATDNAGELLKDLNLEYNKARQAAITGEILEIVSGAEALNG